jgi:hypothetical protein
VEPLETRKAKVLPRHRDEIDAIAQEWGVSSQLLWDVHLRLLSGCAFIVLAPTEKNPQKILRHMDFEYPEVLGPATVVLVRRSKECKATVTVTWPGFAGVISGMNEDGLVVAFNASFARDFPSTGMPVLFKTREILEEAKDVAEAEAIFRRGSGVSEPHFVCVADGQKALVLWRNAEGVQRKELKPPVDCWTNNIDSRTDYVLGLCKKEKKLLAIFHQPGFQKRLFETCAQPSANVQSMIFESSTRSLSLALAKKNVPAWTSEWATCRLAPALRGPMPATLAFLRK